jgi:tRNA (guanine37-N1)-methyltransferase
MAIVLTFEKVEDTLRVSEIDGREFIQTAPLMAWRNPFPPFESRASIRQRQKAERQARESAKSSSTTTASQPTRPASSLVPQNPHVEPIPSSSSGLSPSIEPQVIAHYVMNLPDSALEFLDAYRGSHVALLSEQAFTDKYGKDGQGVELGLVHVHCFTRELERENAEKDICSVSRRFSLRPVAGSAKRLVSR